MELLTNEWENIHSPQKLAVGSYDKLKVKFTWNHRQQEFYADYLLSKYHKCLWSMEMM